MPFAGDEQRLQEWIDIHVITCMCGASAFAPPQLIRALPIMSGGYDTPSPGGMYDVHTDGALVQLTCTTCGRITLLDAWISGALH